MIFETERLLIRKLNLNDLGPFHQLESNPKVLKYATGEVKNLKENNIELLDLIARYDKHLNDFWIYAIERKLDNKFIGTLALVKDNINDEIGYRFLEKYWGNGYGFEVCKATIIYCKQRGIKKLVGYVVDENIASVKILKKLNFKIVTYFLSDDIKLPETKYELEL
ncbi:GNAT family N-acetyltransferase [Polaribacter litorisediminis]|uniref:GNAT family N-acetyltransferase n=1 Tax=Polaribacter litorisediminis TaxID=1908341 RepID=UPI001CC100E8|nr:GNAT family N-acetyltransferase [Polaribacter litorisediminis]UAM99247.1 GNAT family N-acetyltransferase [Polaribacter litorisediminis]